MGGSGGGTFHGTDPAELASLVRKAESRAADETFKTEVAGFLTDLLGSFNGRDTELVRERLAQVKDSLEGALDGSIDTLFGGSVAKHTYVDGLSDVDSLLILNDTHLAAESPEQARNLIFGELDKKLDAAVSVGRMAVTIEYNDGMQIQLLPTVERKDGSLLIPSSRRANEWSHVNPRGFEEALTAANAACGGKLVPTIKLAKAINALLPSDQQLSGYHMESIGIAAFRSYDGPKTPSAMLPVYFERAAEIVMSPIHDRSGQSVHVDGYLGDAGSRERKATSHIMTRIAKRMNNASVASSLQQWRAIFGEDD